LPFVILLGFNTISIKVFFQSWLDLLTLVGIEMNVRTPLVSCILPVYNAEEYLSESLDSILSQTESDFELIIINDGSTDKSLSIIEKFAQQDSRIRFLDRENKGLNYSLNEALSLSRGVFIARMDADDVSLPTRFEKQLNLLESSEADICGCHFLSIDENSKKIDSTIVPLTSDAILTNLCITVPFAHGSVMIRKEFLLQYGLKYGMRDHTTAEDYDLWIQMYEKKAKFCNVDDYLFEYRDYGNSISKSNSRNLKNDAKALSRQMFNNHSEDIKSSISDMLKLSLSQEEKNYVIACSLYLFIFGKSTIFCSVLRKMPIKNLVVTGTKFLSGRFF